MAADRMLIDGDCMMCSRSARFATRWVNPNLISQPWQAAPIESFGLTARECDTAVHVVTADGAVTSGGDAIITVLRSGRQPWRLIGALAALPLVRPLVRAMYRVIAHQRRHLQ
jgi:predicted DCC family thiol-disulfide oxidoreductase YuxK